MTNQAVKVKRDTVVACMTCPLCNELVKDATTIAECLHTFCRKCIIDKISDEEIECCPICYTDLGCVPLEKLRPDHNLQDVRAKIFPSKRRKVKAPEAAPPITLPPRRKERSLSELVVNAPKVSTRGARVVAELDDSSPTSRSLWTEVNNFKKRLELMFSLRDVEAGQTFQKPDGRFKPLQMMTQSLCMAYGNALKDEERDVELEKLKEEMNRIEDLFSEFAQTRDLERANLDLVKENADLRKEITSANNDLLQLRAEQEIIQEELGCLHLKLSVAHRELEEEQTQAWENYDYLFEEYWGLQKSMKKQEDDRQREQEASATTISTLQSEVETLQREREQDRKTALEALNQTNQDLQARLEQIQKELEETKAAAPDRRSIVEDWSRSKCFHYAARYHYGFSTAVGYSICRKDVLKVTPDYDITPLRFMNERFLTNGMTLLKLPTKPPQVCFEDEVEALLHEWKIPPYECWAWALQPVYSQEEPYEGEVLPKKRKKKDKSFL